MKNIVERYELNDTVIEIEVSSHGFDVICHWHNKTEHFLNDVSLATAYAFVAGFMYDRVKLMESEATR